MSKILIDEAKLLRWISALKNCYDVDVYPSDGSTAQDKAIAEMIQALEQPAPAQTPVKWSDYEYDGIHRKPLEERLKDAFYEGFTSSATYNDIELNDVDEEWLKYAAKNGITKGTP